MPAIMKLANYILYLCLIYFLFSCVEEGDMINGSESSSGSYAKMLSKGDFLYMANFSELITFNIEERSNPIEIQRERLNFGVESMFIQDSLMFIGSTSRLYIYSIQNNGILSLVSQTPYSNININPCDPVVANDSIAYVTLSTSQNLLDRCARATPVNQLRLFNIRNINKPELLRIITIYITIIIIIKSIGTILNSRKNESSIPRIIINISR